MKYIKLFEEWNLLDEGYKHRPADFQFADFETARKFARTLGLRSESDWRVFSKSAKLPYDIPADPYTQYKKRGLWKGWGDFLGTGNVATQLKEYRPFEEAREFIRSLGLKNEDEWRDYRVSGDKPHDIPSNPNVTYANQGWAGFGDFLGTGNIKHGSIEYRPFEEAREFVRGLGLKNQNEWQEYCVSGEKPKDIPSGPSEVYRKSGWAGYGDFLGTGNVPFHTRTFMPFEEAREFVRSLGLKNENEWKEYCKSGEKPYNLPSRPQIKYENDGWISYEDFLGTETINQKESPEIFNDSDSEDENIVSS